MDEIFTLDEIKDILISVLVLSLCLTIATGNLNSSKLVKLPLYIAFFSLSVGSGFVLHELGHKFVAIAFGGYARFQKWTSGLIFALLTSFLGVVFIAPGAVYIFAPHLALWEYAVISAAGPIVNLSLAFLFSIMAKVVPVWVGRLELWHFAAFINVWLGLFNLLPIPPLDGSKIFSWNILVWLGMVIIFFLAFIVVGGGY